MAREIRAWILASLAALAAGVALGAVGLGGGLNSAIVGVAAFGITFLFVKNGYGLRKVVTGTEAQRELALSQVAGLENAIVYLVRDGKAGMIGIDVTIDGRPTARLKGGRFTQVATTPGAHTIAATFTQGALGAIPSASIEIELRPGTSTGVLIAPPNVQSPKTCMLAASEIDPALRARLQTMTLVKPD